MTNNKTNNDDFISDITGFIIWNIIALALFAGYYFIGMSACKTLLHWMMILKIFIGILFFGLTAIILYLIKTGSLEPVRGSDYLKKNDRKKLFAMIVTCVIDFIVLYECGFYKTAIILLIISALAALLNDFLANKLFADLDSTSK